MSATESRTSHKHFRLDSIRLKRAQEALKAKTETETVERALEMVVSDHERSRLAVEATQRFLRSGVEIRDVFAALERPGR